MNLATLADRNLAEFGEYDRLVFEARTYTNRELHDAACRLAAALLELGLGTDDKVVVMLPNCPEVLIAYAAAWRAGLVVIPVLFLLEAHELAYILQNSGAKLVVTAPVLQDKVRTAIAGLASPPRVVVVGSDFDELVRDAKPLANAVERAASDLAVVLYTSGTTGQPKGVMQTHGNLYANAMNAWNTATTHDRTEIALLVLPLAHSFGLGIAVSGYLNGTKAVLMRWFDPEGALRLIQQHRATGMAGVPTMFVLMLLHPKAGEFDTSSMKRWLVGAAPMPAQQLEEFERKFGGTMYVGYGLTESCPGIACEREGMPRKPGSTGIPMEGVAVKIVDDAGVEVRRGTPGEVCAKGDNISPGYYAMPGATAETFKDGWLYTGDIGVMDEDGYLFIVERKKDLIIRGGFNVYPKDVEGVLYRHAAVAEAAVVGVPDLRMGEEVCAYVVKRPGAEVTAEELIAHCQADLAKYKTPRHVEFLAAMPKTIVGKIQKKELRRLAKQKFGAE